MKKMCIVQIDGQEMLMGDHFFCLGSIIHHDGEIEEDVVD